MKTINFSMDLMVPSQLNKDIIFNEALLKIDSFMNFTVVDFIDHIPKQLENGEKFIISSGEHKNKICYKLLDSKGIDLQQPQAGMIVFVIKANYFFVFNNEDWEIVPLSSIKPEDQTIQPQFIGINQKFSVSPKQAHYYLYLDSTTEIEIEPRINPEVSIIIKQSAIDLFNIKWPTNIIWEQKQPHIMSQSKNSMDLIKLFQLPESHHFLGTIIAQNFSY